MSSSNGFTPTEKRIMAVLSDWRPHTKEELFNTFDDMASKDALRMHIVNIRKKLAAKHQDVICRQEMFQLVSLLPPDE